MAVVGCVQFLELHAVLYSGNKTRNTGKLPSVRAGSWKTFRADGATKRFHPAALGKHGSESTVGKINHLQTV